MPSKTYRKESGRLKSSGANQADQKLQVNLQYLNPDNTTTIADATAIRFNEGYSTKVTSEDAGKINNTDENIAVVRDGRTLTVERRPFISDADTIFLKMYNMKAKEYEFEISVSNFETSNLSAFLEDGFLNTMTPISMLEATKVKFTVSTNAGSARANRLKLYLKSTIHFLLNLLQ